MEADGSSFNWRVYFGTDLQWVCFNDTKRVQHRFGRTANSHLMVIMKVRPAREINEATLNEYLKHMALTMLSTLDPTSWDLDERMIAARSLDTGDIAINRTDWAQVKQQRRVQVKNDMVTTNKKQKGKCKNDKSLAIVVDWERAFGAEPPAGERSVERKLASPG